MSTASSSAPATSSWTTPRVASLCMPHEAGGARGVAPGWEALHSRVDDGTVRKVRTSRVWRGAGRVSSRWSPFRHTMAEVVPQARSRPDNIELRLTEASSQLRWLHIRIRGPTLVLGALSVAATVATYLLRRGHPESEWTRLIMPSALSMLLLSFQPSDKLMLKVIVIPLISVAAAAVSWSWTTAGMRAARAAQAGEGEDR